MKFYYSVIFMLAILVVLVVSPTCANSKTWFVETNGPGNLSPIQMAINSASAGDTLQLGVGVFDDYIINPLYQTLNFVKVTKDNLTIRGMGADQTIIGNPRENSEPNWVYLMNVEEGLSLVLEDLTLQLLDTERTELLRARGASLTLSNCNFRGSYWGVSAMAIEHLSINNCEFSNIVDPGVRVSAHGPVVIENSVFEDVKLGVYISGSAPVTVSDCSFDGQDAWFNSAGIVASGAEDLSIERCTFFGHTRAAILFSGGTTRLVDCSITETEGFGLEVSNGFLEGSDNTIYSESNVLVFSGYLSTTNFHHNHFIAGGNGLLARVFYTSGPGGTVNLEQNWWGTDDADQISAGIIDGLDNPEFSMIINFMPFLGGPVEVESISWGDLKANYRK